MTASVVSVVVPQCFQGRHPEHRVPSRRGTIARFGPADPRVMRMSFASGADGFAHLLYAPHSIGPHKAVDRDSAKRNDQHSDFPRFNAKTITRLRRLHSRKRSLGRARICQPRLIVVCNFLTSPIGLPSVPRHRLGVAQCTTTTPPTGFPGAIPAPHALSSRVIRQDLSVVSPSCMPVCGGCCVVANVAFHELVLHAFGIAEYRGGKLNEIAIGKVGRHPAGTCNS
jgi:hypothetical protein